ncbi:MAG: hypothetical protein LIP05_10555 [Tannerellaceae bacterium]|nr:hypothetical protein [Tannerellaceae bacterium]
MAGDQDEDIFSYRIIVKQSDIVTDQQSVNRKTFNLHLKRLDQGVRLMILANSTSALNTLQDNDILKEGISRTELVEQLTFHAVWNESEIHTFNKAFPMWGETTQRVYAQESETISIQEVVKLLRAVARVDIGADIYGDPALGFGQRFQIEEVIVYRSNREGYLVPDISRIVNDQVTAPTIPQTTPLKPLSFIYTADSQEKAMVSKIYLTESEACEEGKESEATCLVIGAVFNGGARSYYRIDFINSSKQYMPVLRNHRYLINITGIAKDGYATADAAANARSASIQYDLEITDENIDEIVVGNDYTLGTSKSPAILDWYARATTKISVMTEYPGGWTAAVTAGDSWLNIVSTLQNNPGETGEVVIEATSQNTESLFRTGAITFTAGALSKTVMVRQRMGANAYIVTTHSLVNLPVAFANADGQIRVHNQPVEASLLWMDSPGVITAVTPPADPGVDAIIQVQTGATEGNAIVAAVDLTTQEILWSWHLWVTNDTPDTHTTYHNGVTFMDRNLGALSATPGRETYGLLYQWGRKDPFPGASPLTGTEQEIYDLSGTPVEIRIATVEEQDNRTNAVQHPTTFYTSATAPYYSWTGLVASTNLLWEDAEGEKTAYDPCPDGWRVPVSGSGNLSPWQGLTPGLSSSFIAAGGWEWTSAGYYPATGCRMSDTGRLTDVGVRGYVWSATPYGINAYLFRFGSAATSIYTSAGDYRANGFAVRCVRED